MLNPLSRRHRRIGLLAIFLLLHTGTKATPPFAFFPSLSGDYAHILQFYALYPSAAFRTMSGDTVISKDNGRLIGPASVVIRPDSAGNVVVRMPASGGLKYKIRFFDPENVFLFEIRQIRDSSLTIEKVNFDHGGIFRYEIYWENQLLERSNFIIKNE